MASSLGVGVGRSRLEIATLARLRRLYETPVPTRVTEPSSRSSPERGRRRSSATPSPLELWLTLHTLQRELGSDCDGLRREVQLCEAQTAPSRHLQLAIDANTLGVTTPKWLVLRDVLGVATFHQYVRDVFRDVAGLRRRAALYDERWRRFDECVRLGCIVGHQQLQTSVSHERCLDLLNDALRRVDLLVPAPRPQGVAEDEDEDVVLLLSEAPVLLKHCSDPAAPHQVVLSELLELLGRLPPARERATQLCFEQLADARRSDGVAPPPDAVKAHRLVSLAKQSHAKALATDAELDVVLTWLEGAGYRDVSMDSFLTWHLARSDELHDQDAEFVSFLQRVWGFDCSSSQHEQLRAVLANYETRRELTAASARKQDVLQRAEHAVSAVLPGRLATLQATLTDCTTVTFDRLGPTWDLATAYLFPTSQASPLSTALATTLSKLVTLRLVNLELREFPSLLLDPTALPLVQVLDLQSNRLAGRLPPTIGHRKALTALLLARNELDDACFPDEADAWDGLHALETLELSCNRLTRLPLVVSGLTGLKTLSLAGNRMRDANALSTTALKRWASKGCRLETLDLRDNGLTAVPSEVFIAVTATLERLHLQHNALESLPPAFTSLTRLQDAQLSHNRLVQLAGDVAALLRRCSHLKSVELDHNQLCQFPLAANTPAEAEAGATSVPNVRVIRLQFNRLRVLPALATASFEGCEELDLQKNAIRDISDAFFLAFPSLKVCDLSENALSVLPDAIVSCRRLETLDVHGNRLESVPTALSSLERLQVLNLRDNRLTHVPKEWHRFADHEDAATLRCPVLHTLQLQKNPLRNKVLRLLVDGPDQSGAARQQSHHVFQTADTAVCEMYVKKLTDHLKQTTAVMALARAVHRDEDEDGEQESQDADQDEERTKRCRLRQRKWKGKARYVLQLLCQRLLEMGDAAVRLPTPRFQDLLRKLQPASSKKEVRLLASRFVCEEGGNAGEELVDGVAFLEAVETVGLYGTLGQRARPTTPGQDDGKRSGPVVSVGKPQSTTTAILRYLQVAHEQRQQTKMNEAAMAIESAPETKRPARPKPSNQEKQQSQRDTSSVRLATKKPGVVKTDRPDEERRRELESSRQRERIRVLEQQLLDQQLLRLTERTTLAALSGEAEPRAVEKQASSGDSLVVSVRSLSALSTKTMELVILRSAQVEDLKTAIAQRLAIDASKQLVLILRRPEDSTHVRLSDSDLTTAVERWVCPGNGLSIAHGVSISSSRSSTTPYDYTTSDPSIQPTRPRGFSRHHATDIKARVAQLLADKSTLRIRLLSRENWIKNELRPNCYFCDRKFRPFNRKHHCRACGDVVCSGCNRHRVVQIGPGLTETVSVRLCFDCIDKAVAYNERHAAGIACRDQGDRAPYSSSCCSSGFQQRSMVDSTDSGCSTLVESLTRLELSSYEGDDTDHDGYDTDDAGREGSWSSFTSRRERSVDSTCSASSKRNLGFVPEDHVASRSIAEDVEMAIDNVNNERRRSLLREFNVRSPDFQREYDALCELASRALSSAVAAVAFLDADVQWYKSRIGISQTELPRDVAFCSHVLHENGPTVVLDVSKDIRFRRNLLVTGAAHIRFYASTPIRDPATKLVLGSVFVMDPTPKHKMPSRTMEVLSYLSSAAERLLELARGDKKRRRKERHRRVHSESSVPELTAEDLAVPPPPQRHPSKNNRSESFSAEDEYQQSQRQRSHARRRSRRSVSPRKPEKRGTSGIQLFNPEDLVGTTAASSASASSNGTSQPSVCMELLQQINDTQRMLASLRQSRHSRNSAVSSASSSSRRAAPADVGEVEV
ncbi:hypothetical protein ATCC90586_005845 [Pythium insidiosum]|nr:hypothetical protein ATCC90586_005845 [Pythium insidiosum]